MPDCFVVPFPKSWSSLVEGGEGLYQSNCLTTLVIALDAVVSIVLYFHKLSSLPCLNQLTPWKIFFATAQKELTQGAVGHMMAN